MKEIKSYQRLANGVILQAVADYRKALRGKLVIPGQSPERTIKELESFFKSEWFRMLSKIDGETLMNKIKGEKNERRTYSSYTGTCKHYK